MATLSQLSYGPGNERNGGPGGHRTRYPLRAKQALSQLSYEPGCGVSRPARGLWLKNHSLEYPVQDFGIQSLSCPPQDILEYTILLVDPVGIEPTTSRLPALRSPD